MKMLIAIPLALLAAGLSTAQALDKLILLVRRNLEHLDVGNTAQFDLNMLTGFAGRRGYRSGSKATGAEWIEMTEVVEFVTRIVDAKLAGGFSPANLSIGRGCGEGMMTDRTCDMQYRVDLRFLPSPVVLLWQSPKVNKG